MGVAIYIEFVSNWSIETIKWIVAITILLTAHTGKAIPTFQPEESMFYTEIVINLRFVSYKSSTFSTIMFHWSPLYYIYI